MKFGLALLMVGVPLGAMAATAGEVADLEAKVAAAEKRLEAVQARITAARARHKSADGQLQEAVRTMVRVGQYPQGFWLMRSVVMDTPAQAELMQVVARMQGQQLVQAQREAGQLAELYGDVNRQLQAVRDVQAAYGDAHGQLLAAEKAVLRRAGIQADALSEDLQAALDSSVTIVEEAPRKAATVRREEAAGGLPVAGRVERAFGSGQGASKAGVVLKAAAGAQVRATQAGRVLYAGPFRHFGGLVIVKTVRGEDVVLGGLGTLSVKAGDDVGAGTVLGGLGDEGRLYWEVRRRGRAVNPLD